MNVAVSGVAEGQWYSFLQLLHHHVPQPYVNVASSGGSVLPLCAPPYVIVTGAFAK